MTSCVIIHYFYPISILYSHITRFSYYKNITRNIHQHRTTIITENKTITSSIIHNFLIKSHPANNNQVSKYFFRGAVRKNRAWRGSKIDEFDSRRGIATFRPRQDDIGVSRQFIIRINHSGGGRRASTMQRFPPVRGSTIQKRTSIPHAILTSRWSNRAALPRSHSRFFAFMNPLVLAMFTIVADNSDQVLHTCTWLVLILVHVTRVG